MALAAKVLRYLVTGKGMLIYSASLAAASVKVLEESATPDVQCSIPPQLQGQPDWPPDVRPSGPFRGSTIFPASPPAPG